MVNSTTLLAYLVNSQAGMLTELKTDKRKIGGGKKEMAGL